MYPPTSPTTRLHAARPRALLLALTALLAAGSGCSNHPLAPHDTLPPQNATPAEAAQIAGALAWAMARVGPEFLKDPTLGARIGLKSSLTFTGAVTGTCDIVFTNDSGAAVTWNQATRGRLVTDRGPLVFHGSTIGLLADWQLTCDLTAVIDQSAHAAVVDGSGALILGGYTDPYTVAGLAVSLNGFPAAGTLDATVGSTGATVQFTGGASATVTAGGQTYRLDLGTGLTTPLP